MNKYDKKTNHQAVSDIRWLNATLSTDQTRPGLHNIVVQDGFAWATNGHVVHMVSVDNVLDLEDGVYEVIKSTMSVAIINQVTDPCRCPDIWGAIPDKIQPHNGLNFLPTHKADVLSGTFAKVIRKMVSEENTLNFRYFERMCDGNLVTPYPQEEPYAPVVFTTTGNRMAVIMPTRM